MTASLEHRVLVLAPSGRDGALAAQVLEQARIDTAICGDAGALIAGLVEGAGAALVAEEALTADVLARLMAALQAQPPWSDFPIIIFTAKASTAKQNRRALEAFAGLGNVTVLERPVHPLTMVSGARAALRARARQYAARAVLEEREREVRQRDQFLAMLGHELRNPLGAIQSAAELAQSGWDPARAVRAFRIINRQSNHLTRLVDDLLDVARVTSGKIVLKREPVELVGLTRELVEDAARSARDRRLTIETHLPAEPVIVIGDAVRLEQIVNNLLTNALKYTPAGGRIDVAVSGGERATVTVTDTGVGLAADMLPMIFEPFTQAARTLERAQGGMGLGLNVVRALARLHGGEAAVDSPGLGRGSTFSIHLPIATGAIIEVEPAPEAAAPPFVARHILIVEDGADNREALAELLITCGHRVDEAMDGEQGIERALAVRPEVALVDIGLPRADGYEVARQIRAALGSAISLIALTGYGQPDDRARALAAGFDAHLTKPVALPTLDRLLARLAPAGPAAAEAARRAAGTEQVRVRGGTH